MRIAVVEPEAARNDTAFQAQARMWELIAREHGCSFTVFADRRLRYRNEWLEVRPVRRIGGRFWCPPYPGLLPQLKRYEVIITDDPSLYPHALWAAMAARASGSRLILDTSVTLMRPTRASRTGRLILRLARAIFGLAHRVIVPTPLTAQRLVKLGLLPWGSDKVVELGHPVDTRLFRPREAPRDGPIVNVLSAGKLVYEKGHHVVIEALADLMERRDGLRLLIAGEGPYRRALEELSHRRGVADKVLFLGRVPNERLAELYRRCDVFVHQPLAVGSWEEYFGVVLVEAMSSGLPLVASDCGSVRHVVPDGAGFLIGQNEGGALREKVDLLIEDRRLRAEMGARGREHVRRRYSMLKLARRCYEQALN